MDNEVAINVPTPLEVSLSREELEAVVGPASGGASATISLTSNISVVVIGRRNFRVVDPPNGWWSDAPPTPDQPVTLVFLVEGTDAGEGELWVYFRQGSRQLARLELRPRIVVGQPNPTRRLNERATPEDPGPQPLIPLLQIDERIEGNGFGYTFNLIVDHTQAPVRASGDLLKQDRAAYVKNLYDNIESLWTTHHLDKPVFERKLRSYGGELFDALMPPAFRHRLWELRADMHGMIVYSSEPFIPWELVHLKQPAVPGQPDPGLPNESLFLGELGITRWLSNNEGNDPPQRIRVRKGRSFFCIPDYRHDGHKLPAAQEERVFLSKALHATEVQAEAINLQNLFSNPDSFDLFHFAGHGFAENENIANAQIMMLERLEGAHYLPRYFEATTVEQCPPFDQGSSDGNRPAVVFNACQIGRAGYKLTRIGGFAQAFVSRRAGLFVGTLWSVGDVLARTFTESLYKGLLQGMTLADASRHARNTSRDAGDPTWMAYVVYGSPALRLSIEPPPMHLLEDIKAMKKPVFRPSSANPAD